MQFHKLNYGLREHGDKCGHCGERSTTTHRNHHFEIPHVAVQPLACNTSPENPAVMVEVNDAALADATMMNVFLLALAPQEHPPQ